MEKKVKRRYSFSDENLLKKAVTAHDNAKKDLPLFVARLPWFDATYLSGFKNDISAAKSYDTDNKITAEKKVVGNKQPIMKEATRSLSLLFKYVLIAYYGNKKKQNFFGIQRLSLARNNILKMTVLLEHTYNRANKLPYKNDLLNAGITQAMIDNLQTIFTNLSAKHCEHTIAQTGRPVSTVERTELFNKVYEYLRTINTCAKIVFMKSPAKKKQYKIY